MYFVWASCRSFSRAMYFVWASLRIASTTVNGRRNCPRARISASAGLPAASSIAFRTSGPLSAMARLPRFMPPTRSSITHVSSETRSASATSRMFAVTFARVPSAAG